MAQPATWPPLSEPASDAPLVLTRAEAGVGYLVLNRPAKRNALDAALRKAVVDALAEWRNNEHVRVVVLTGAGKAFAAGADLRELLARTPETQRAFLTPPHIYDAVSNFPMPVIACVNGHALGAGCELMMACDLRIAADSARIGQPEITLGLIPGGGGTQRLPRLVGFGRAMRMVLSGEALSAEDAAKIGLVEEVVEDGRLHAHVKSFAETMAARSPVALRAAKAAMRVAWERPLSEGLAYEVERFMETFGSSEARKAIDAFLNRGAGRP